MSNVNVGIVGVGTYLPSKIMTAKEISDATNGVWSEDAVRNKLGINQKPVPGDDDGTQEMGARAAKACLENTGIDPKEIDVILCIGEEWKEYPLTTSAIYIQDQIGAVNAWGIDVQNRCCTCVAAMEIAKDMLIADDDINTIMVVGGYRNGDFVDYTDKDMSMMYNLAAGENIAKDIVCPVLALNGKQDITTPEVMTAENRQAIKGIVQKYYDDCGHSILNDQPELLVKDILEFVK